MVRKHVLNIVKNFASQFGKRRHDAVPEYLQVELRFLLIIKNDPADCVARNVFFFTYFTLLVKTEFGADSGGKK